MYLFAALIDGLRAINAEGKKVRNYAPLVDYVQERGQQLKEDRTPIVMEACPFTKPELKTLRANRPTHRRIQTFEHLNEFGFAGRPKQKISKYWNKAA